MEKKKDMTFTYADARITPDAPQRLRDELGLMRKAIKDGGYDDERASLNLCDDTAMLRSVLRVVNDKSKKKPSLVVVVGIGGSNLGTVAVQEAVLGKLHNLEGVPRILYADTVDSDSLYAIADAMQRELKAGRRVIVNAVSKSGGTTETIANFEVLLDVLKRHAPSYADDIVVTTDKGSKFWELAQTQGFATLEIPKKVGGRYSVFSPVGLFPLGMIGVDVGRLLAGAASMRSQCLGVRGPAAVSASLLYKHYRRGRNIADLFLFSNDLESIGKWYRQLMGESIGKEHDRKGKRVQVGITPTVSVGSTDLHSMAQLYLGGPQDKFTTFVRVISPYRSVRLPTLRSYDDLVPDIQGRPMPELMDAIIQGVQAAFRKGKRPFLEVTLPEKSEYHIGQLLQFKMMEMMLLGALLGVNPFDQPNVEAYKIETKRILSS